MLAAVLLLAALNGGGPLGSLAGEAFRVPAHDYRYVPVRIANWPATLISSIQVTSGPSITLDVLNRRELTRFVRGESPDFILRMAEGRKFEFRQALPEKGEYETVLINDGDQPSDVRFEATVEFAREPDVARYVSAGRRLAMVAISLLVFVGTVSWSGWKLMGAMRGT